MQKKQKKDLYAQKAKSFKLFKKQLTHITDRLQELQGMATFLLSETTLTDRQLSFKRNFFNHFARELAGPCGCTEVIPDHLRIDNPKRTQFLIELMGALYKYNILGDISLKQLARILICILRTDYTPEGMLNRLKNPLPEFMFVSEAVADLYAKMKKKK